MKIHLAFLNILKALWWVLWTAICVVLFLSFEIVSLLWLLLPLSFRWAVVISLVTVMLGKAMEDEGYHQMPVTYAAASTSGCSLPSEVADAAIQVDWPGVYRWCSLIMASAMEYQLSPEIVAAIMYVESRGEPSAYSTSGAVGLMQVMPKDGIAAQFQCQNGPCFGNRPLIVELENPEVNVDYGSMLLRSNFDRLQDMREALKAYGPMNYGYVYADLVLETCRKISPQATSC